MVVPMRGVAEHGRTLDNFRGLASIATVMLQAGCRVGSVLLVAILLTGAEVAAVPSTVRTTLSEPSVGSQRVVADLLPLSQPTQNYFVEAILGGVYGHAASPYYTEFRNDGLLTRGTARFAGDPSVCIVGPSDSSPVRPAIEALLADAVGRLTAGTASAIFLPNSCWTAPFPASPDLLGCQDLPADQITVFLWQGGGPQGIPCQGHAAVPPTGGTITGGRLTGPLPPDENLTAETAQTLRHELGHVFGLEHTWGDPNLMLYRSGRTMDFAPLELEAFAALYELPPGIGLGALIGMGVIADDPAVLNEPPAIEGTTISGQFAENNHGAVGQDIVLWGQRLTLAFSTESVVEYRPINYAPPVVSFGDVSIVPDLGAAYQTDPTNWFGRPAGVLKVPIPPGAGTPIQVTTRGQSVVFPGFALDGPSVPSPPLTPKSVVGLNCQKTAQGNFLTWSLPPTYADNATSLNFDQVLRRILRNGVVIAELSDGLGFVDGATYPVHEAHLYQIVLVNLANGQQGIPSSVCAVPSDLATAAFTPSPTRTPPSSRTPTFSPSPTVPALTPTSARPPSSTPTPTPTQSRVPTVTLTSRPTATQTPTTTVTSAFTPTPSRTAPVATVTPTPTPPTPTATASQSVTPAQTCTGDCGHDRSVTVNDLLAMVNIALGNAASSLCTAGDANGDGRIVINELVLAVHNALNGCR